MQLQKLMSTVRCHRLGLFCCYALHYIPGAGLDRLTRSTGCSGSSRKGEGNCPGYPSGWAKNRGPGPFGRTSYFLQSIRSLFDLSTNGQEFWADDKCNGCGICSKVCPAANIETTNEKPAWRHRCEQCLACLQWCHKKRFNMEENIQGPAISSPWSHLKDMLDRRKLTKVETQISFIAGFPHDSNGLFILTRK